MSEPVETTQPTQVCSIRIGFPVESDEQAIEYKKKLDAIIADIPKSRIEFTLIPMPLGLPNGSQVH